MIDVDMYVSRTLSEEMAQEGRVAHYENLCADRRATILPAFEPTRPGSKGRIMAMKLSKGTLTHSQLRLLAWRHAVWLPAGIKLEERNDSACCSRATSVVFRTSDLRSSSPEPY
ncbi:hypothetical protein Vafri_19032 [Volvox africanus]|uniref:Uncharacterized protein n=1 Tax=Volvox africanus TaxID=51714 RepID=A0A8J4BNU6_9CHLO|nr:hypothetical protein Vafri_19032 [Volvox africanus]